MGVFLKPSVESIASPDAFLTDTPENLMKDAVPVPTIAGITKQEGYMFFRSKRTIDSKIGIVPLL